MQVDQIKQVAEREPFRPFGIRLVNGVDYWFKEPRDLRATRDYSMIFFFGENAGGVRIDRDYIAET